ncbi:ABC transporter ATP-binding protein [Priestia aryabhattai]|uniref:ABC transporter ATP-binding protein n=1 Tax=Priestia aryabhattai TaxID=412384 RepID=UPI0027E537D5|nr:ABC transporter ATP-binding protein [Priestia aryabhattai]WJX02682.1 ABC transporter ATP-binding protein [Priestia aryabhattai]
MRKILKNIKIISKTIKLIYKITGRNFYFVILLTLFSGLSPVISVILVQRLLNAIEIKESTLYELSILLVSYLGFSLLTSLMMNVSSYFSDKLRIALEYKINYLLIEKSGKLSLKDFENADIYNKLTRLENEVNYKPFQTFQALMSVISSLVTFLSSAIILLLWKPLLVVILLILPFISMFYYLKIARENFTINYNRSNSEREAWYISYLLTHDFSFKEVKMYGLKEYFADRFWKLKSHFKKQDNAINKKKMIYGFIFNTVQDLCLGYVVFIAVLSAFAGKILIGNVATYIKSIGMVQSSSQNIINNIYLLYESNLYMELLNEFLCLETENTGVSNGVTIDQISNIEFKNVSFSYDGNKDVLKNISFKIKKGELLAIIGVNGSGKSTLLKLICGLYSNYSGDILVNNLNLRNVNKESYRRCVSVLFQDYLKYEFTLGENVYLGNVSSRENSLKIDNALKAADISFMKSDESTYEKNTQLGNWFDEGAQLSGGQWQKVAIARTYFREGSVLLLDEPSSALDAISEKNVFESFFKLSRNEICIFITHKVKIAKNSEKILVLNNGVIEGIGTHSELIKTSQSYNGLYQRDNKESEELAHN